MGSLRRLPSCAAQVAAAANNKNPPPAPLCLYIHNCVCPAICYNAFVYRENHQPPSPHTHIVFQQTVSLPPSFPRPQSSPHAPPMNIESLSPLRPHFPRNAVLFTPPCLSYTSPTNPAPHTPADAYFLCLSPCFLTPNPTPEILLLLLLNLFYSRL